MTLPDEPDGQDQAEVFDEENITPDGRDIATPDLAQGVYDATQLDEDSGDAAEADDDFDPDLADEAQLELALEGEEGRAEPRSFAPDAADRVSDEALQPADLEGGAPEADEIDRLLDEELDQSFPASDPASLNRRSR